MRECRNWRNNLDSVRGFRILDTGYYLVFGAAFPNDGVVTLLQGVFYPSKLPLSALTFIVAAMCTTSKSAHARVTSNYIHKPLSFRIV